MRALEATESSCGIFEELTDAIEEAEDEVFDWLLLEDLKKRLAEAKKEEEGFSSKAGRVFSSIGGCCCEEGAGTVVVISGVG